MAQHFSLGFSDNGSLNRLDEILARTQQAGATAVGRLQEQTLASQLLGANGSASRIELSGRQIGEASFGTSGSEATGSLDEILAGVQSERANNEATLLGNGTPLVQALLGGIINLVGEGVALIPGLEDASGIGTALLGRKKDANKLLDRELDIKGLIAEREQRKFENEFAVNREARIAKSEEMQIENDFKAEERQARRDKKAAKKKFQRDKKLAKILSDDRFRSQGSAQAARSSDLDVTLRSSEKIAEGKQKQLLDTATAANADKTEAKKEKAADARTGVLQPAAAEAINKLRENAKNTPGMAVVIGGADGKSGILNMQLRGEFDIVTLPDGSPALKKESSDVLRRHLIDQGVKAHTDDEVLPEEFVRTYKDALGISGIALQESLENRSDANTPAGIAAAKEMRDFAIVRTVANNMSAEVAVEVQSIIQQKENMIVAGTLLSTLFPGQGQSLIDLADGEYSSIADFDKKAQGPISKILKDGQLSQILEAYSAYKSGDSRSLDFLIRAGIFQSTGNRNTTGRSAGTGSIITTELGRKLPALIEALGGNR